MRVSSSTWRRNKIFAWISVSFLRWYRTLLSFAWMKIMKKLNSLVCLISNIKVKQTWILLKSILLKLSLICHFECAPRMMRLLRTSSPKSWLKRSSKMNNLGLKIANKKKVETERKRVLKNNNLLPF